MIKSINRIIVLSSLSFFLIGEVFASNLYKTSITRKCLELTDSIQLEIPMFFNFLKHKLFLSKDRCVITVKNEKYFLSKKEWVIDICRVPVHIKMSGDAGRVVKKVKRCDPFLEVQNKDDFCSQGDQVLKEISDLGLIYAQGERGDITSDHGKIACMHKLIYDYVINDVIFSVLDQKVIQVNELFNNFDHKKDELEEEHVDFIGPEKINQLKRDRVNADEEHDSNAEEEKDISF